MKINSANYFQKYILKINANANYKPITSKYKTHNKYFFIKEFIISILDFIE